MTVIFWAVAILLILSWFLSLIAVYMLGQAHLARDQMAHRERLMNSVIFNIEKFFKVAKKSDYQVIF